jgi:hypothetical protein
MTVPEAIVHDLARTDNTAPCLANPAAAVVSRSA